MVEFAKEYPNKEIIEQFIGQIPWDYNLILLQRIKEKEERFWYIHKTILNGWSQQHLVHWIDREFYKRKRKSLTNFQKTLSPLQSDLVEQILNDPYCFDFLAFINTRKGYEPGTK